MLLFLRKIKCVALVAQIVEASVCGSTSVWSRFDPVGAYIFEALRQLQNSQHYF